LNPIFAAPVGAWEGNKDIVLTKDDLEYIEGLRKKHLFLRRDVDANFVERGCGAVKEAVYLTAYGDVLPCPFIHISLGNVLEEPLEKIRKRGLEIKYFNHYHKKCLAAEDRNFMVKYSSFMANREQVPANFSDVSKELK
jgi:MoaA/NifB/PqqE/SkfB family radical SAM enzyme